MLALFIIGWGCWRSCFACSAFTRRKSSGEYDAVFSGHLFYEAFPSFISFSCFLKNSLGLVGLRGGECVAVGWC